jgi:DNA-binding transcriptional regulator YbjK
MTTTARTDQAAEQATTRNRILRATLRVIGEHGIGAVSNRRLAAEAGVALGSLTYHFPSQTELLRESLLLFVQEEVDRLNAIASAIRGTKPSEPEVAETVERIVDESALGVEQIAEFELHLQAARDPELREAAQRCFDAYDGVAMAALQALDVPNPERHARTVVAYLSGLAVRGLATGHRDASGTAEALLTFLRGIRATAGGAD